MWLVFESDLHPGLGEGMARMVIATDRENVLVADSPTSVSYFGQGGPNITRSLSDARRLDVSYSCAQGPCDGTKMLRSWITQASFDLRDDVAPLGAASGAAIAASTWSGPTGVAIDATDAGAGLARAIVEVDGADAQSIALAGGRASCSDIGPEPAVREYAAAQPCPTSVRGVHTIDTAALPQGDHTVRLLLEDASGNRTSIFGPVTRRIDAADAQIGPGSDPARRGDLNGRGARDDARLSAHWGDRGRRTLLTSAFGHRHVVRGRLTTAAGGPIADARLDLLSRTTAVNARSLPKRGPVTGADGRFSVTLPSNVSSRDLTLRYRSHVADTIPVASSALRLRVRAGVRLRVSPHVARRGGTVRFSGRLLGGPVPRGGKLIVLMVRGRTGPWLRFNVVRTDRRGRFRAAYRFKQPGAARYRFRALSLAEAAYPYLAGGSNAAIVRKR